MSELAGKYASELTGKATDAELILKDLLIDNSIIFEFQKAFFNTKRIYILDFYFESTNNEKYAIELDGNHHKLKSVKRKDKERSSWLFNAKRIKVLRFYNSQLQSNPHSVIAVIMSFNPKIYKN